MMGDAERKELTVLADHVPQLLGQGGQLSYEKGYDKINYRPFIETVQFRLNEN